MRFYRPSGPSGRINKPLKGTTKIMEDRTMSERQKNKLLAVYLILTTAGVQVSDGLKQAVEDIKNERAAAYVAAH